MVPFELKWQAPEYEYRQKSISWYWTSIIISILILGAAIWQKNFLFGLFIVIAEILVLSWANRTPPLVDFTLNEKGFSIGTQKSYAYTELESFSIDTFNETIWPSLFLQFKKRLKPPLKAKIPKERLPEIEKTLKTVLKQTEHQHSMLDTLEEFVGF